MARSGGTMDNFIDRATQIKKVKWDHDGLRQANKYGAKAMQLMINDMDNPELPLAFQYAARQLVIKYAYGNPMDAEKMKITQELFDREGADGLSFRYEHLKQINDNTVMRLLDTLFVEGKLDEYMEMKRGEQVESRQESNVVPLLGDK